MNVYQFVNEWNNITSPRDQFLTTVEITSQYYSLEINGIHINHIELLEDSIVIYTWNNRRNKLIITPDLSFELKNN